MESYNINMPKPSKSPRSCKFSRSQTKTGKVRTSCLSSNKRYTSRRCSISKSNRCVVSRSKMSKSASNAMSPKAKSPKKSVTIELVEDMQLEVMSPVSSAVMSDMKSNMKNLAPPSSLENAKMSMTKKQSPKSPKLYILKKHKKRKSPSSGLRAPQATPM
jgi:hypothetical protein